MEQKKTQHEIEMDNLFAAEGRHLAGIQLDHAMWLANHEMHQIEIRKLEESNNRWWNIAKRISGLSDAELAEQMNDE